MIGDFISSLRTRYMLRRCYSVGKNPTVLGRVWVHGEGKVILGNRVHIDGSACPVELHVCDGATLEIGDDVWIEEGSSIQASSKILIEQGCRIGSYCKLLDSHLHRTTGSRAREDSPPPKPLVLEEHAVLGSGVIILPGAHVSRRATILPRAVLSRRVPPGICVGGQPLRRMRQEDR